MGNTFSSISLRIDEDIISSKFKSFLVAVRSEPTIEDAG
jgi:hypothetical protein